VTFALYSSPHHGVIFAPHVDLAWQISGKSILGSQQVGTIASTNGVPYITSPIVATKDFVPDVFTWTVGTEVAFGSRNTMIVDVLGNQIGLVHGATLLKNQALPTGFNAPAGAITPQTSGLVYNGRGSLGQYSGAFGYKVRVVGNLVATFQALVRFNDSGLTARVVPLYGLGYSF